MRRPRRAEPPTSYVRHNRDGTTSYVGELAKKLFQAQQLRAILASPMGPLSTVKLLVIAQAFTGHRYTHHDRHRAIHDMDDWIAGMELVVPIIEET